MNHMRKANVGRSWLSQTYSGVKVASGSKAMSVKVTILCDRAAQNMPMLLKVNISDSQELNKYLFKQNFCRGFL